MAEQPAMGSPIKPGRYFLSGNIASAEAAILAGCRFYAGYPITPSSDLMEHLARRFPQVGGILVQMEDEIGSIAAAIGAAWTGAKAMTATSGPGLSLMAENIGFAAMTETPLVIVDVMRGGPSTGQPTIASQGDVMQARWGSHGDYEIIALSPNSVQEYFDLTIKAFNLAEEYRVPVLVLSDAEIAHMVESIVVPEDVEVVYRETYPAGVRVPRPFEAKCDDCVPPFPVFGRGNKVHVTGLTHDERGYPDTVSPETHSRLVWRLVNKIRKNADRIADVEVLNPDADVLIVSYGIASRSVYAAVKAGRAGLFRPRVLWPFPERRFAEVVEGKKVAVVEMNTGQYFYEVERLALKHGAESIHLMPRLGGAHPKPREVVDFVGGLGGGA